MNSLQPIKGIDIYLLDQFLKGRLSKKMRVLDAGCGYGRNIRWLLEKGYHITAVDANVEAIDQLKADFLGVEDCFSTGRVEDLSVEMTFDFVICNAVLHFANGHAHFEAMFAQLVNSLAQNGILFIRMTSSVGLETKIRNGKDGVFYLPDGSWRYLLTRPKVDELIQKHPLRLIEPVKTVFVDGLRSMTTLVFQKSQ